MTDTTGARLKYDVVPLSTPDGVEWIDAAGFRLARSAPAGVVLGQAHRSDFVLQITPNQVVIERTFAPR